uniref:Ig-like domain-containing protein n=1 Tax=Sander lucioperca TaxID=283035 RepID=A0A8D0D9A0_SANLU
MDMQQLQTLIEAARRTVKCKGEDRVTQPTGDVITTEGETVTLGCTFETTKYNYNFFWYRQYPGKPPEFLIFHSGTQNETNYRLSVSVSDDKTKMDLQISSAAVTDSALYYCAVRPTVTANPQSLYKNTS